MPGDYEVWFAIEMGLGLALFLIYNYAVVKNSLQRRITAWAVLFVIFGLAIGSVYLIEALAHPRLGG
jgi:hypothetical protein